LSGGFWGHFPVKSPQFPQVGKARAQLYHLAPMKIIRNTNTDPVPDAIRFALFLNVFVRQPVAPRRRNVQGR